MTRDQIINAVEVSAQARVSRLFDVLCLEVVSGPDNDNAAALARFMVGIHRTRQVVSAATTAIEQGEGE